MFFNNWGNLVVSQDALVGREDHAPGEALLAGGQWCPPVDVEEGKLAESLARRGAERGGQVRRRHALGHDQRQVALGGLAPQARALVSIMADLAKELGSASFGGAALEARLKVPEVAALLRTKQDPLRILQYYKGKLISVGLIRVS